MKQIVSLTLLIALIGCSNSKIKNTSDSATAGIAVADNMVYPVAVSFNSICCGTPSSDFLKTFIVQFNQKNNTKISAHIAAGCGKEGEFTVLFNMTENDAANQKFTTELSSLVAKTNDQNKKASTSSGGIALVENAKTADFSFCRLGISAWNLQ